MEPDKQIPFGREMLKHFGLRPGFRNLNNGSFGQVPTAILQQQRQFQDDTEAAPDIWFRSTQARLLGEARRAIAQLVNVQASTVVLVPNATTGINSVLRNIVYDPGDKILVFSTLYEACLKTVLSICETTPVEMVMVDLQYPMTDDAVIAAFRSVVETELAKGNKIKVALFDTITSLPAVRMPFEHLTSLCRHYDILSCVDGAHGVGLIELDLTALDADFFVSNAHKWLSTPRGCAVFHVAERNQKLIRTTLPTSLGFVPRDNSMGTGNTLPMGANFENDFVAMHEYVGTADVSAMLCVPAALRFRQATFGGEQAFMKYCAELAWEGGLLVAGKLDTEVMQQDIIFPQDRFGMVNVRLPLNRSEVELQDSSEVLIYQWMSDKLLNEYHAYGRVFWHGGHWWIRLSAQAWLHMSDFEWMAATLQDLCNRVMLKEHLSQGS